MERKREKEMEWRKGEQKNMTKPAKAAGGLPFPTNPTLTRVIRSDDNVSFRQPVGINAAMLATVDVDPNHAAKRLKRNGNHKRPRGHDETEYNRKKKE